MKCIAKAVYTICVFVGVHRQQIHEERSCILILKFRIENCNLYNAIIAHTKKADEKQNKTNRNKSKLKQINE